MNSSAWIVLSLVFAGVGLAAGEAPAAARAGDLVRLLGDPSYAVRERAEEKLYRMGRSAAEELKKGLADADPEVRRRCRYLYPLALRSDEEIQLEAFLNDEAGRVGAPAGWRKFREAAGEDRAARALFLEIYRSDKTFGAILEKDPAKLSEQLQTRVQKLQEAMVRRRVGGRLAGDATPAEMAMVLVAAAYVPASQQQRLSFSMLANCFYRGTTQADVQSSPALRRLLIVTLGKHVGDPDKLLAIVRISTLLQLREFQEGAVKPAVRKLAKAAASGDGSRVGNIAVMANQLGLSDVFEELKPAVRKAAEAFAKDPTDWTRFYNVQNAVQLMNMPDVVEETIKPAVVKFMASIAERSNDQNEFFQALQFGQQLGLEKEIETVLKPAAAKLVAKLVKEPTDQNKFTQALNVVQLIDLPEARDTVLKPAARKLIAEAAKSSGDDVNKLIQASNIAGQLGIREESDKVLQPLVRRCAELAAKSGDLSKLSQAYILANNLLAPKVIDDVIKPAARKALAAAVGEPIKAASLKDALYLAKQLDLKEGLALAIKAVGQKDLDVNSRAAAVVAVGEVGGKEAIEKLEPVLNDKTSLGQIMLGGISLKTELRDVALAALVTADGGQPADYGFVFPGFWGARPISAISVRYLGFSDDATREAALKKWKERGVGKK